MSRQVVSRDPDVMGGTPVFCGTRVPVQTLLDYLEAGESIDQFLEGFPSVTREQVDAFRLLKLMNKFEWDDGFDYKAERERR